MPGPKPTHYETLGLAPGANQEAVKAAYRKLVLLHHPDRSKAPNATERFLAIKEAYETLSHPDRRLIYDRQLQAARNPSPGPGASTNPPPSTTNRSQARPRPRPAPEPHNPRDVKVPDLTTEMARLVSLFTKARHNEAEKLALQLIERAPKTAMPYAVLADIARARGDLARATKMYAFAAQMDPRNPVYMRKYEDLIGQSQAVETRSVTSPNPEPSAVYGLAVSAAVVVIGCAYIALAREPALLPDLSLISSWSLGLLAMLLICGIATGAGLSVGRLLDRFELLSSGAVGRLGPEAALAFVAVVNFWVACALYAWVMTAQRFRHQSTARLLAAVGSVTLIASLASSATGRLDPLQVFLWGGNVAYIGALCGWMVAEALREATR